MARIVRYAVISPEDGDRVGVEYDTLDEAVVRSDLQDTIVRREYEMCGEYVMREPVPDKSDPGW